ncbi:MAG: response regulator [Coleofasciculaceae cyanobacterium]
MKRNQEPERKSKILIVDDKPDNLRLLAKILTEQGYEVRKAINGSTALMGVQAASPDLILLDIRMPDLDGYKVCQKLKGSEQTRDIPVIFLSALNEVLDKVKAFEVGGVDYITKPFQMQEVLVRVKNQLTIRHQQKLLQAEIDQRQKIEGALRLSEAREREKANQLEITLKKLKRTQAQLIHNEKMSSLGQMLAGVAHEINNPVSFIYGNLAPAREYCRDLISLIQVYQQTYPHATPEIKSLTQEIDLDFLVKDWPKLMTSMQVGAQRIQDIVLSLRSFSRKNESNVKPTDIHNCIDSTILILQHRLRAVGNRPEIKLIKEYGQLPLISCHGGQLNQVFINLISNAVDALEQELVKAPTITISTEVISTENNLNAENSNLITSKVVIRITDNGAGMNKEVQNKIFDPFFTTKPVGSGTGLGLSISHQIVAEIHGGKLSCISEPRKGTEFVVEIPINNVFDRGEAFAQSS